MVSWRLGERWARGPRLPVPPARCGDADVPLLQAAARHQCRYLVNLHVLQFLRAGGDPQWLRGLDFIPPKLRNLNEINKILAHRPWLITKEHIEVFGMAGELSARDQGSGGDGSIPRGCVPSPCPRRIAGLSLSCRSC